MFFTNYFFYRRSKIFKKLKKKKAHEQKKNYCNNFEFYKYKNPNSLIYKYKCNHDNSSEWYLGAHGYTDLYASKQT